jgi:hypothetical protein
MTVRTRAKPKPSKAFIGPAPWTGIVIFSIGCLLVFLDALAITWYLWKLPESSLDHLNKTLRIAGGWVTAGFSFLGLKHTIDKAQGWQWAAGLIVITTTILVWFLLLPVHSLYLTVTDDSGPLADATATIAGEDVPRGAASDPRGSLVVGSLTAAKYDVLVARKGYVSQHRIFPFLDVVRPGASVPLKLEHEVSVLVISSKPPGASITVDSRQWGSTPAEIPLPTGGHQVKLALAGCQALQLFVETRSGERHTEAKDLVCGKLYPLLISTRQDGIGITVDRIDKGMGPLSTRLAAGEHTITARLDGRTQTQTVWIPRQSVVTFDMGQAP